ncbi:DUF2793 domain-containing protein [Novosphingobium flavum]|uniref:DUF2793 domain-containing protein n=1 Tax=Novosphingobium flavum TaxID=1778672 RepID=A0A7X1FQD9_9SPHN|nr:DUF2793 domain-containing protein [Novosphingobium flavum]MBC2665041.1 DUF2793 domain-containing protein [Novosphingobium flavum]
MSDPITFDSVSPRLGLPLLFAGQAQKEAFVNEALSILDGLSHAAIEAEQAAPPAAPLDGQAWLIASGASDDWSGRAGQVALRQGGQWLYVAPRDGMRLLNAATGQDLRRVGGAWRKATALAPPSGGTVVDAEARNAIAAIFSAMQQAGIFPL